MAAGKLVAHPTTVELHLGTACNLACPECVSRPTLDTACFDPERAVGVARELAATGVRCVVLSGGGEPLLHPAAGRVLQALHASGISAGLVTNGTLLHHHEQAVVSYADRIRVSVDAATAETYGAFRPARAGGNLFSQLLSNLEAIGPRTRGRLTCSFVLLTRRSSRGAEAESNVGELAQAARLAKSLGCSSFEVNVGFDSSLLPNPLHVLVSRQLADQLQAATQLADEDFRFSTDPFIARLADGQELTELPARRYARCPAAQLRALVSPRGVFLCPVHQTSPAACYGDPSASRLEELWGSAAYENALGRIDPRVNCPGACMSMDLNEKLLRAIDWVRARGATPHLIPDEDLFM